MDASSGISLKEEKFQWLKNEKQTNKERLKDINRQHRTGIQESFPVDKYAEYLKNYGRSSVQRYNQMLIYMHETDATLWWLNKWRDQLNAMS